MASAVEYQDDPTILDEDILWRRIPPWHFVHDDNEDRLRPSSAAFENDPNGNPMSVLLASIVQKTGRGPTDAIIGHAGFALVSISAGIARECQQRIVRDPLPDEPAHGLVVGHKTKAIQRRMAKAAIWVIPPVNEH